jgi:competence protein ComEA
VTRAGLAGPSRRYDPGRGGLFAMAAVAGLVALLVGGWVLSSRPHRIPVAAPVATSSSAALSPGGSLQSPVSGPSPSPTGSLVVDVAGKVRHPGVYRLPSGARVQDAVTAAGGMAAGVDPVSVNLARKLTDGEQLVIGLPAPPEPAISGAGGAASRSGGGPVGSGGSSGSGPVDLNTATVEQLDALPGVGPVLAQRIVDWRSQHGRFDTVDQLSDVAGIGAAKLADLTPLVIVS